MNRKLTFACSLLAGTNLALAQNVQELRRLPGAPKDAGTYNFATGTWTRGDDTGLQTLPGVLYNNTASSRTYATTSAVEINWTDEGRLPSTSGHANSTTDSYTVNGFQVAYCDAGVPGPLNFRIDFFELYTACTDPRALTIDFSASATLPGLAGTGSASCWIVTFDLSGTSLAFDLDGDGDGSFDGTSSLDNFGWGLHLDDGHATTGTFGPILCYDPQGYFGCAAAEGDGTYYQPGTCSGPYAFGNFGSGLGLQDNHYSYAPGWNNGCYWFGGYDSMTPASGFWMVVYGEAGERPQWCLPNSNSVGPGASISISGSGSVGAGDTVASVQGVPNQSGVFFHGSNQIEIPFGCGSLCASGGIRRSTVVVASGNAATYAYDESGPKRSLAGFENTRRNFQFWYRDPMHASVCGHTFNMSDGVALDVLP